MKKYNSIYKFKIILGCLFLAGMISCKKDFLDRKPITSISPVNFFNTASDLQLYVNKYYSSLGPLPGGFDIGFSGYDQGTDDLVGPSYSALFAGKTTLPSGGGWSYGNIRDVNYFFANYAKATGDQNLINQYLGEASFFRAWFYFPNIKNYGDVPLIDKVLPAVYDKVKDIPRTARNLVIDFMLNDLDTAIANLPLKSDATRGRLNKEAALLFKSRVALYEGTWEKYHKDDVFGVAGSDGSKYLKIARDAAKALMDLNTRSISGNTIMDYDKLFMSLDLSTNTEAILWKDYSIAEGITTLVQKYGNGGNNVGMTKTFIESFLCLNGKPIKYNGTTNPMYQGDNDLTKIKINRDPRLNVVWISPGQQVSENAIYIVPALNRGNEFRDVTGYQIRKGIDSTITRPPVVNVSYATIIFRYAEALLNYAEARAELGEITQADLDMTVNALRARATDAQGHRVAELTLAGTGVTDDNPEYSYGSSPIVNEIRRERRVELSLEGFRKDDLMRWAIADKIFKNGYLPLGIKYLGTPTEAYFAANLPDWNASTIAGDGKGQYLNSDGYIDPFKGALPEGYSFKAERDYLRPLSINEISLGGYKQNPGW